MTRLSRRFVRPLQAALLLVVLAGCVPASPDVDTYDDKAMRTLGAAVSETKTVRTLLQTSYDGRMLRPTALAQLRYSESALGTATKAFTELNPPPARDGLYTRASTLLGDAEDLVAEARITVERKRESAYPGLVEKLDGLATRLEKLEARTR